MGMDMDMGMGMNMDMDMSDHAHRSDSDSGSDSGGEPIHDRRQPSYSHHRDDNVGDIHVHRREMNGNGSGNGNGNSRLARFYEKSFWVAITVIIMLVGSFFMNGASKRDIDEKISAHSEKTAEQLSAIRSQIEMVIKRQDRMIENVESTNVAVGKLQTQVDKMGRR
jgi:hypothetical protein